MFARLREDIAVIMERDPAARSPLEIILTYPGLHAIWFHRLSHRFYLSRRYTAARFVSHLGRFVTGIEIHPGATVGKRLFIDHGMGVVVGETATIGDDVTIYQGVTLGGTGKERGKRHPDIGNNVIIGVGAKVLGAITIGEGAKIGGGSVVLKDVPAHTTAVGNPARSVAWTDPQSGRTQRRESLPDPLQDTVRALSERIEELEQRLRELERAPNDNAVRSDRLA